MSVSAQAVIDQIFLQQLICCARRLSTALGMTLRQSLARLENLFSSRPLEEYSNAELYENLKNGSSLFAALTRDAHDSMEKKLIFKGGRPWSVFV